MDSGPFEATATEEVLQLRYRGNEGELTELNAAAVAEVLQGLVGLAKDFAVAGAFGDGPPPTLKVRPPREGSFILEVTNWIAQNPKEASVAAGAIGIPSLGSVIMWATKSMRAEVSGADELANGNRLLHFTDDTVEEVPDPVWQELNKRTRKRKKQLREIMAPLGAPDVAIVEVRDAVTPENEPVPTAVQPTGVLEQADYQAVLPHDEITEEDETFETEAQMVTVDFDSGEKWRVRTPGHAPRTATVEDGEFLAKVAGGLALHKTDIFQLRIRSTVVVKNGRSRTTWTVLKVISHRRGADDEE